MFADVSSSRSRSSYEQDKTGLARIGYSRYAGRAIHSTLADIAVKHCGLLTKHILNGDVATHNQPVRKLRTGI